MAIERSDLDLVKPIFYETGIRFACEYEALANAVHSLKTAPRLPNRIAKPAKRIFADDPQEPAAAAGLRYVSDWLPAIRGQ